MTMLEARLVRIDVENCSNISCSVYSNNTKIGALTSLEYSESGNCLLIPIQGNLKIVVSASGQALGSVTFPFSLINDSGCLWLPIIPNESSDYIDVLPEELSSPKILLYFEKKTEESDDKIDEIVVVKEKLRAMKGNYKDFVKKSKEREISLIKLLEDKEAVIQDYVDQLSKAQSHIFSLLAEKKHLSDSLVRLEVEMSFGSQSGLVQELEITRQELMKSESKNESLLRKLEEISIEWNFIEEESKHIKESELLGQISQLKQELDLKSKEISVLKNAPLSSVLSEISNKLSVIDKGSSELSDTVKYSNPNKMQSSASTDQLPNSSFVIESIQASMISEEDSIMPNSMYSHSSSRGISPGLKENFKNNEKCIKASFRCPTISSQNKSKYIPIVTSRRLNQSVERKNKY